MSSQSRSEKSCPVARALEILGDRWTLLVIRDLLSGPSRFQDLLESAAPISPSVLSDRLKRLETSRLVQSRLYTQHPPRFEYSLTRKGRALRPVLGVLRDYATRHLAAVVETAS